jgi:hypothetical protein
VFEICGNVDMMHCGWNSTDKACALDGDKKPKPVDPHLKKLIAANYKLDFPTCQTCKSPMRPHGALS